MSRGFVKEGDQEELPVIPPRAPLPPGSTNYVTPQGFRDLLAERESLEEERRKVPKGNETEHRHTTMLIDGRLALLQERIASARVIDPENSPQHEVRFGATVTFRNGKETQQFQIVGVDEADIRQQKIAFTAPIAHALTGKKAGERAEFRRRGKVEKLEVLEVKYAQA